MKNSFYYILLFFLINLSNFSYSRANEPFNFDVTILEIFQNGNLIKGSGGGTVTSNDGILIEAINFEYIKDLGILHAIGDVRIIDNKNSINIEAPKITYFINLEKIFSTGKTTALLENNYNFLSEDVLLLRDKMEISSKKKTRILDKNFTQYLLDSFHYDHKINILKGINIIINENINSTKLDSDQYFLSSGFFNLETKNFKSQDLIINLKKNIFDVEENDPRLAGVSSSKNGETTIINKGVFTSCKFNDDNCPPWAIYAKKITHDKNKKTLVYDDAILKIYDFPVMYFPKFFHPDPTVNRKSGFLQPRFNKSNILGTSVTTPYFYTISDDSDITIKPTIFDKNLQMVQAEYRRQNKNSFFITDFNLVNNFKSTLSNTKNSITHLFSRFNLDLNLENYDVSNLNLFIEKVSNDTYLKIFDSILVEMPLTKPNNFNNLKSGLDLFLSNKSSALSFGMTSYEDLTKKNNDRYQYVLPYYNFTNNLYNGILGNLDFNSNGNNNLTDTNIIKTSIINNLGYTSNENIISKFGILNNFEIYLKNLNRVGKNNQTYKSNPKSDFSNLYVINTSLPFSKTDLNNFQTLTPKLSLMFNPSDMINHKNSSGYINTSNIFSINRLGLDDTLETGKSLTLGLDYKLENYLNENNDFRLSLATVFRDEIEDNIPKQSTINQKNSNLFGLLEYNFSELFGLDYEFQLDNKFEIFELNNIGLNFNTDNFTTEIKFIEENGSRGNTNLLENNFTYKLNDNNYLSFKTRRNRTINLTEYYDLLYEYENDCLTAAVKYKKTYYSDRELKPMEDLMFSITIYPITTVEQKIDKDLYRN